MPTFSKAAYFIWTLLNSAARRSAPFSYHMFINSVHRFAFINMDFFENSETIPAHISATEDLSTYVAKMQSGSFCIKRYNTSFSFFVHCLRSASNTLFTSLDAPSDRTSFFLDPSKWPYTSFCPTAIIKRLLKMTQFAPSSSSFLTAVLNSDNEVDMV